MYNNHAELDFVLSGSPGSGVDVQCKKLVEKFSGFVQAKDISSAQNSSDAKGIILEDYPANKSDIEEFNEKVINKISIVFFFW
jgi:tRNA uridine 5-carbamoylmethylation protein Kti12